MDLTFRPTRRYWTTHIIIPLVGLLIVSVVAGRLFSSDANVGLGTWCAMFMIAISLMLALFFIYNAVLLAFRYVLHVYENGVVGRTGTRAKFEVLWSDVIAVWIAHTGIHNQPYLFLGTLEGTFFVRLAPFDKDNIWKAVQSRVSPDALGEEAQRRLPGYQNWVSLCEELAKEVSVQALCVDINRADAKIGWITLMFFSILAVWAFWQEDPIPALEFAAFAALGGALVLSSGSVEMDAEAITRTNRLGRHRMKWSEIRRVEMSTGETRIVCYGDDKRLVIPGPKAWSGSDQGRMWSWLHAQLIKHQIDLGWSYLAEFKLSKNVRLT